jgi:hypothetical protein
MEEKEMRDFLAQFDKAREEIKTWPRWMQDAAYTAAATFPTSEPASTPPLEPARTQGT